MGTVIKDFWCKVEEKIYKAGSEYNGKRLEELVAKGFVEVQESKTSKKKLKSDEQAVI